MLAVGELFVWARKARSQARSACGIAGRRWVLLWPKAERFARRRRALCRAPAPVVRRKAKAERSMLAVSELFVWARDLGVSCQFWQILLLLCECTWEYSEADVIMLLLLYSPLPLKSNMQFIEISHLTIICLHKIHILKWNYRCMYFCSKEKRAKWHNSLSYIEPVICKYH